MLNHECTYVNDPEMLSPLSHGTELLIEVLPAALHTSVDDLEYACNCAITSLKNVTNAILLLYGLCGNALKYVVAREDVHLVTVEDDGIVDDCFVGLLGRNEYNMQLQRGGSFFLTNGWVTHWDSIGPRIAGKTGMKGMLAANNYVRGLYVSQEDVDTHDTLVCAKELSDSLGLGHEHAVGGPRLLEDAFERGIQTAMTAKKIIKIKKD